MLGQDALVLVWLPLVVAVAIIQMRKNASFGHTLGILILTTYACALVAVTLFPLPLQHELLAHLRTSDKALSNNFQPFKTIGDVLSSRITGVALRQLGGNLLLLVPSTFLMPALWKKLRSFKSAIIIAAVVSFSIEFLQFTISAALGFTYKITDIDDFLINVAGAAIGYIAYAIVARIARAKSLPDRTPTPNIKTAVE